MKSLFVLYICFSCISASLYNVSDPVTLLDSTNFYETILNTNNGWIIQFYNSWCGHCINFAPKWKKFSMEINDWNHTVKSGVIDCSDENNVPICRDYEVMSYPSIRMFGAFTKKGDIGKTLNQGPSQLQDSLVDILIETEKEGRSSNSWVNLLPYNDSIKGLFDKSPKEAKFGVIIAEESDSKIGSQAILDLGKYSMVYCRRMEKNNKEIVAMKLRSFPAVIILKRDGDVQRLKESPTTREELTALIMHELKLPKQVAKRNNILSGGKDEKEEVEGAGDGNPEEINSDRLNYDDDAPDSAYNAQDSRVFMVDIENAVSYALRHEVSLHKVITGDALRALKGFLKTLVKYLPARAQLHNFLSGLEDFVSKTKDGEQLTGERYNKALGLLESPSSMLPAKQPWKGCQGSVPKYRGYPCGLWSLFHVITVNALITYEEDKLYDPLEPLKGIHGYVKHFFSCAHCSKHFQEMYGADAEASVKAPSDEVLWLWKGHNKVNKRIAGDLSEDPEHRKLQFPPKKLCPKCWKEEEYFDQTEVLLFLKKVYEGKALSMEGAQAFPPSGYDPSARNRQAKVYDVVVARNSQRKEPGKGNNVVAQKINAWSLNRTDVNLCVVLYLFSTLIIVAGYMMFILKRKLRRKKFYDLYKKP